MSQLKTLASQTIIYGASSILGRLINYLLVGLHTSIFLPEALGVVTALYAYVAIIMIAYTYGMETTFFRYAKEDPKKTYHAAFTIVVVVSTALTLFLFGFSNELAKAIGYPETGLYIKWSALIMWIDAFSAVPFAHLRFQNKAKKFASVKIANILLNIFLQYLMLSLLPSLSVNFQPSIGHIFLANLVSNGVIIFFLLKEISELRVRIDMPTVKKMLKYSSPIFLMGMAGMLNEQLDKVLIEHLLPDSFYENMNSTAALGVYGQTFKIGVFMMLAVQAFRYAGEPFFFAQAEDKKAPELFAKVMHYFIISGLLLFVLVSLNVDLLASIFLRKPEFRVALYLVPLLLFGKLLYGVYLNLSIWFKLKDKTEFGLYFGLLGVLITIIGNVILLPKLGLLGCALTIICCYATMCIVCYFLGKRYFPIPYKFVAIIPYLIVSISLVLLSHYFRLSNEFLDMAAKAAISIVLVYLLWLTEKQKLTTKNI
ncbi:MAG: oligosaccharide flippase family protein [Bacteroidota bacterium]